MTRKEQVKLIIRAIEDELEEILSSQELDSLSPEECIGLAMEITLHDLSEAPKPTTKMLTGTIDKKKVLFMLDNQTAVPLFEDYYEGDDNDEDTLL